MNDTKPSQRIINPTTLGTSSDHDGERVSAFNRHEPDFDVLHQISEGLYTFTTRFLFQGTHPTHNRSVIVHVPAPAAGERGALVIINPAELQPRVRRQLEQLEVDLFAKVRYLISPGDWHWLFIHEYTSAFAEAIAYVPPGRIPEMHPEFAYRLIEVAARSPFPELAPHVHTLYFDGLLEFTVPEAARPRHEFVFYFPKARAITSGDVLYYHGVDELSERQKSLGAKARVVDFHFAKSRMVRDSAAVQRSLQSMLTWDFDRYISIHGAPGNMLERGARAHVEQVLEWARGLERNQGSRVSTQP